jgi:ribosomal protein S18 acetylase RimI-like enzyme
MIMLLRKSQKSDIQFMRAMLYEAVFWRASDQKPSIREGLAYPEVSKVLTDWGKRTGDTAVVGTIDDKSVGAAWYRYWTEKNTIRGYIDESTPVFVIGVHQDYRRQGIGGKMIEWLIAEAGKQSVQRVSLMVSKDNHAINLYRKQGFVEYADKDDSLIMVRDIPI